MHGISTRHKQNLHRKDLHPAGCAALAYTHLHTIRAPLKSTRPCTLMVTCFHSHTDDNGVGNSVNIIIILYTHTHSCSGGGTIKIIIIIIIAVWAYSTLHSGCSGARKVDASLFPVDHRIHIVTPSSFHGER